MLLLEAVHAERHRAEAGGLGLLDVALRPGQTVRDHVDQRAQLDQTSADLVPARVKGRLATNQGDVPAAEIHQLASHAQTLIERQLVRSPSAGDGTAVLAPQVAEEGQLPHARVREDSGLPEDLDHGLPGQLPVRAASSLDAIRYRSLLPSDETSSDGLASATPASGTLASGASATAASRNSPVP